MIVNATDGLAFVSEAGDQGDIWVSAGTRVRWFSDSEMPHTVTPDGHEEFPRGEASEPSTRGELLTEHVFLTPGSFDYYCEFHGEEGMRGTVHVHDQF